MQVSCIALVDDDEFIREAAEIALEDEVEWRLSSYESGAAFLADIERSKPDLILLDLNMPEMDGTEVLKRLKAHSIWAPIPVLLLTATKDSGRIEKLFANGAAGVIEKPFDPLALPNLIRQQIARFS